MLAPNLTAAVSWPIPGDVAELNVIIDAQAQAIEDQEALLHAYQQNLNTAQNPAAGPAATGTGAAVTASTSLPVSSVTGTIVNGATVAGTGISTAVTVLGLISGTVGGAGTYLVSAPVTIAASTALTFTPPAPAPGTGWPIPQDAPTLNLIMQQQTAIIRTQAALLQHYQDVLNTSQTPAPPTGP